MPLKKYTEFPDVIDKSGMILLLADPVTGALFKIDQSLLSAIVSAPNLQAVTDVDFKTTNEIWSSTFNIFNGTDFLAGLSTITDGTNTGGTLTLKSMNTPNGSTLTSQDNLTASHINQLPDTNGTLAVSVNGIAADSTGDITLTVGATPNLQAVTGVGNNTTHSIEIDNDNSAHIGVFSASGNAYAEINKGVDGGLGGLLTLANDTGKNVAINASLLTANYTLKLPNAGAGDFTSPLSVNGVAADSTGNITISVGGSTSNLQAVTTAGNATTDIIVAGGMTVLNPASNSALHLYNGSTNHINITTNNLTTSSAIELPNVSGTFALSVNGVAANTTGNVVLPSLASGNYVPTISGMSSNALYASQGAGTFLYSRVGSVVTLSGHFGLLVTSATGLMSFTVSLPIASTFASTSDGGGTIVGGFGSYGPGLILAGAGDTVLSFSIVNLGTGGKTFSFTSQYTII